MTLSVEKIYYRHPSVDRAAGALQIILSNIVSNAKHASFPVRATQSLNTAPQPLVIT